MAPFYAVRLKKTRKYLGVSVSGNNDDAQYCNSYTAEWTAYGPPHLFEDRPRLEKTLKDPPKWYNSGLEAPMAGHAFKDVNEVEIVEVVFP